MTVVGHLANLDRRVLRQHPAARFTAPAAPTPDDGPLRPVLLCQSQRVALWLLCFAIAAVCVAGFLLKSFSSPTAYSGIIQALLVPLSPGIVIGRSIGAESRRRLDRRSPPALRWLPADAPVRQPVIFSSLFVAALGLAAVTVVLALSSASAALLITPLEYCFFIPLLELPTRARWRRAEQARGGQVLRLARGNRKNRGTSGLYFRAAAAPAPVSAQAVGGQPSDPRNAYRALTF